MRKNSRYEMSSARAEKERRIKRKKRIRIVIIILELIILACLGVAAYAISKYQKVDKVEIKKEEVEIDEEVALQLSGYTTIALFGCDSRDGELEKGTRTDTIMVAAIDNDTKTVRIISIYRDTLLQLENGTYNKVNAAYSLGGPQDAIATLNKNLDLNITDYVTVDFGAMSDAIDLMGGLKIKVNEAEANMINKYLKETAKAAGKKKEAIELKGAGTYQMNGPQAVTYARLRKLAGGDYKRTERQRTVIKKMYKQSKKMNIAEINNIINTVFPQISTSIDLGYAIQLAACFKDYTLGEQSGFPFEKTDGIIYSSAGDCVVAWGLKENVQELHEFLYPGSLPELKEGVTADQLPTMTADSETSEESSEDDSLEGVENTEEASLEGAQVSTSTQAPTIERYEPSDTVVSISDTIRSLTNVVRPMGMHWTYYDELVEKQRKAEEKKRKAEEKAAAKKAAEEAKAANGETTDKGVATQ